MHPTSLRMSPWAPLARGCSSGTPCTLVRSPPHGVICVPGNCNTSVVRDDDTPVCILCAYIVCVYCVCTCLCIKVRSSTSICGMHIGIEPPHGTTIELPLCISYTYMHLHTITSYYHPHTTIHHIAVPHQQPSHFLCLVNGIILKLNQQCSRHCIPSSNNGSTLTGGGGEVTNAVTHLLG